MLRMQKLFVLLLLFSSVTINAQDKVYLKDNSLLDGKILESKESKIILQQTELSKKNIDRKDIAVIIYADGRSEIGEYSLAKKEKSKEDLSNKNWMIGTNILQPLGGLGGLMLERKITNHYSVRIGQTFFISRYYGFEATTSILNNFYLGKKRVKWMNSFGVNLNYTENQYYPYEGPMLMTEDYIWPYPIEGFNSRIQARLTFGTGVHIELTKHLAFSTQVFISTYTSNNNYSPTYQVTELDINNTGFTFFYKF